jgi:hypothetical protein
MTVGDISTNRSTLEVLMAPRVKLGRRRMSHRQGEQPPAAAPPRYKLALLTWAGAYAVITLVLVVLGPAMAPWPLPLRTLLLSGLMVVALTWLVIPSLTRLCRRWLTSGSPHAAGEPIPTKPPTTRSST